MAERLTVGTIIEAFAANEFVPYDLKKDGGKIAWSFEDPLVAEGDTHKRKRRKISYRERHESGLITPDNTDVLYATEEHVPADRFEMIEVIEEDKQN